jgi:hypothetical protein
MQFVEDFDRGGFNRTAQMSRGLYGIQADGRVTRTKAEIKGIKRMSNEKNKAASVAF